MVAGPGQVVITPGAYVANVVVTFPASLIASAELLTSGIQKKGFTNVRVTTAPPPGWPLSKGADYYVRAAWPAEPKIFDLPHQVTEQKKVA